MCAEWAVHEIIPAEPGAQSLGAERPERLGTTASVGGDVHRWEEAIFLFPASVLRGGKGCVGESWRPAGVQEAVASGGGE